MSWINDLASSLGIPAGAATLAVAMYAACVAAEKAARPEALKDIGRILKDPSWERSVRPSAIIERVFNWTFGELHLSWKCVRRSVVATGLLVMILRFFFSTAKQFESLIVNLRAGMSIAGGLFSVFLTFFVLGFLPDYLALWKTRYLVMLLRHGRIGVLVTSAFDFALSLAVSFGCSVIMMEIIAFSSATMHEYVTQTSINLSYFPDPSASYTGLVERSNSLSNWYGVISGIYRGTIFAFNENVLSVRALLCISTVFTSVWTILILLSTTILKLLAPLHRFTAWFFDVDKHPVQAIGIVAGAFVMIGSLIWSIVRTVI